MGMGARSGVDDLAGDAPCGGSTAPAAPAAVDLVIHPLTPNLWPDLEALFGPRGATGGCWCMWWRLSAKEYDWNKGQPNRDAFASLVAADEQPGLLAYAGGAPVGWCAIGPRDTFPRLARSKLGKQSEQALLARGIDPAACWTAPCFFIARGYRRRGLTGALLDAAVAFARQNGARAVEGFPNVPRTAGGLPDAFAWTGLANTFRRAGFVEVGQPSASRRAMHRYLD
jgi:GNAT superfamily N-acetyltransferase